MTAPAEAEPSDRILSKARGLLWQAAIRVLSLDQSVRRRGRVGRRPVCDHQRRHRQHRLPGARVAAGRLHASVVGVWHR